MSSEIQMRAATIRAGRIYPRSKGFRGAYLNGVRAALSGRPPEVCPYRSLSSGWQAWRAAWMRGFRSVAP